MPLTQLKLPSTMLSENLLKNICYPEPGRHQKQPSASNQNETTMALAHPTTSEVTFESFHNINFQLWNFYHKIISIKLLLRRQEGRQKRDKRIVTRIYEGNAFFSSYLPTATNHNSSHTITNPGRHQSTSPLHCQLNHLWTTLPFHSCPIRIKK